MAQDETELGEVGDLPTKEPDESQDGALSGVSRVLSQTARALAGSTIDIESYDPSRHEPLVSFDGLDGYEELERYWLNAPFAFVSINYDPEETDYLYHVVEPELTEFERELLNRLIEDVRAPLLYREDVADDPETALWEELRERLEEYGVRADEEMFHRLFYSGLRRKPRLQPWDEADMICHEPRDTDGP